MSEWVVWVPITFLALAVAALGVAVLRDRARRSEELAGAYALIAVLEERVGLVEGSGGFETGARAASSTTGRPASSPARAGSSTHEPPYVITRIDEEPHERADHRIDGSLFADLVLREAMVKGISLAYGLGRALSPETRNRIRFLMRQEVKRSRKQRRADLRAARRHLADVQRAEQAREDAA